MKCFKCDGYLPDGTEIIPGIIDNRWTPCPHCGGSGVEPDGWHKPEEKPDNKRKIILLIKMSGSYFQCEGFYGYTWNCIADVSDGQVVAWRDPAPLPEWIKKGAVFNSSEPASIPFTPPPNCERFWLENGKWKFSIISNHEEEKDGVDWLRVIDVLNYKKTGFPKIWYQDMLANAVVGWLEEMGDIHKTQKKFQESQSNADAIRRMLREK